MFSNPLHLSIFRRIKLALIFNGFWQLAVSGFLGLAIIVYGLSRLPSHSKPIIASSATYLTLVVALAAILALVGSLIFGYLLYYFQAVRGERLQLYDRFNGEVKELRRTLDSLHGDGVIDGSYDRRCSSLEEVRLDDFPLSSEDNRLAAILDVIFRDQRSELEDAGEFQRVAWRVVTCASHIEETANALATNWIARIGTEQLLSPVLKVFRTLAVVTSTVIIAVLYYRGIVATIMDGIAVGIGCMTVFLFNEIAVEAARETREISPRETTIAEDSDLESGISE